MSCCGSAHYNAYCLCDSALLADNTAHIFLCNMKMIIYYALLIRFVNLNGNGIGVINKAFGNRF